MSATFMATAPAATKQKVNGQAETIETDVANRQDLAEATLVPRDGTHSYGLYIPLQGANEQAPSKM